ncbi:MAG: LysR family transcriptional regulator [Gammaproteobacteria bacterium]|nr:LysR family transcriptional regulator [Gammaproteobacteria bacterium]
MSLDIPNLRHLRAFRAVAHSRSISEASKRIFLSQPAITQAIAKLERVLDERLFERRSDGVFITEAGSVFLRRVERAGALLADAAREIGRNLGKRAGNTRFDHLLTTTQLRALTAVAEAQNFTLAARAIGISQPSLHRAARDLEKLLDIPLFEKTSQGIGLTRAAKTLAQSAKLVFGEIRQGYEELAALRGIERGTLVVGSMPLARTYLLPSAINDMSRSFPKTHISVIDGPYDDLLHHLRYGDIDLLLGALRFPPPTDDIVQETLFSPPLAVVGRRNHPLAKKRRITIADLRAYPWVVPRPETPTRRQFEQLFDDAGSQPPEQLIESGSLILIRGLLLESDRLTLISAHQVLHEQQMELLAPLHMDLHHTRRPIGIAMRGNWQPTATQEAFLRCLRQRGRLLASQ